MFANSFDMRNILQYIDVKSHAISSVGKVYFRSQILERPSSGEYWNIFGVPVLPENVIFRFFRKSWRHPGANNAGTQKWSRNVQYSCTSIWDLKDIFSAQCSYNIIATPYHNTFRYKDKNLKQIVNFTGNHAYCEHKMLFI